MNFEALYVNPDRAYREGAILPALIVLLAA